MTRASEGRSANEFSALRLYSFSLRCATQRYTYNSRSHCYVSTVPYFAKIIGVYVTLGELLSIRRTRELRRDNGNRIVERTDNRFRDKRVDCFRDQ